MSGPKLLAMKPGQLVLFESEPYRITRNVTMASLLAMRLSDSKEVLLDIQKLREVPEETADGKTPDGVPGMDPLAYSKEDWAEGQRRFQLIDGLLKDPDRSRAKVEAAAAACGKNASTIYKWMADFLESGHVGVLIPSTRGRKLGSKSVTATVEAIISDVIEKKYMKKKRPEKQNKIIEDIQIQCRKAKLPVPHANTIRSRILAVPEKERMMAAGLRNDYVDKKGPLKGHYEAKHPMEVVQIDHMLAKIDLVDDVYRLPLKRPWITLAIDVFSRMVVGFNISTERPSALAAGICVSMAMCQKDEYLAKLGVSGNWHVWGRIGTLHADNAKEFRGNTLKEACKKYTISPMFRPVKRPRYGAHVERLARTLGQMIQDLPGAILDKRRSDNPTLTLKEFEIEVADMVVNKYHERAHSGLEDRSPRAVWESAIEGDRFRPGMGTPPIFGTPEVVKIDFMPGFKKSIQRHGIIHEKVNYYSEVFNSRIREMDPKTHKARKFNFHWSPADISRIYFFDEEAGRYFVIPYANVTYPPISVWELRTIKAAMKAGGMKTDQINEHTIFQYEARMKKRSEEAVAKTKSHRTTTQRRKATAEAHEESLALAKALAPNPPSPGVTLVDQDGPKPAKAAKSKPYTFANIFKGPIRPFDGLEEGK